MILDGDLHELVVVLDGDDLHELVVVQDGDLHELVVVLDGDDLQSCGVQRPKNQGMTRHNLGTFPKIFQ